MKMVKEDIVKAHILGSDNDEISAAENEEDESTWSEESEDSEAD